MDAQADMHGEFVSEGEVHPGGERTTRGCTWLALVGVAALAAVGIAAQGPSSNTINKGSLKKALFLSENVCLSSQLNMDFGSGLKKFDIAAGSGKKERDCPYGSAREDGKIAFECLSTGMWNLDKQTCYDCPAFQQTYTYEVGQEREILLKPGSHGQVDKQECSFQDGTKYSRGHINFKCEDKRWKHVETTCSNHRCRSGKVDLNFYGSIGNVTFNAEEGNGEQILSCPAASPKPEGKIKLKCGKAKANEGADWELESQTCQDCNPAELKISLDEDVLGVFGKETKTVILGAGKIKDMESRVCDLDSKRKYKFGSVTYMCQEGGWTLWANTCHNWVCPSQTAIMDMQYMKDGQTMTGKSKIHLKAAGVGSAEYGCPEGSLDPSGAITFDCKEDSTWQIEKVNCGNGVQIHKG